MTDFLTVSGILQEASSSDHKAKINIETKPV